MKKSWELILFILKVTFFGFGGGNALIPIIRRNAVEDKKWITEDEFDKLVISTNSIPGPNVVEMISFISIKVMGKFWGTIISIVAIFPHVAMAVVIYALANTWLSDYPEYLVVISIGVMPVIIGLLIMFVIRYFKLARKDLSYLTVILISFLTALFGLFVPAPYNIVAIVIVFTIIVVYIVSVFKERKNKQNNNKDKVDN